MHLEDDPDPAVLDFRHQVQVPQRACAIERLGQDRVRELAEALQRDRLPVQHGDVTGDVELVVVDPGGFGQPQRRERQPLAKARHPREAGADLRPQRPDRGPGRLRGRIEQTAPRDVHVSVGCLQSEEGAVERCQPRHGAHVRRWKARPLRVGGRKFRMVVRTHGPALDRRAVRKTLTWTAWRYESGQEGEKIRAWSRWRSQEHRGRRGRGAPSTRLSRRTARPARTGESCWRRYRARTWRVLAAEAVARADGEGVRFGEGANEAAFRLDPVPRLIAAAEWDLLAGGLEQRARALAAFLADMYSEQRIVDAGAVPPWITDAPMVEADLFGFPDLTRPGIAGFDVVRGTDGELLVLEDNLRTPVRRGICGRRPADRGRSASRHAAPTGGHRDPARRAAARDAGGGAPTGQPGWGDRLVVRRPAEQRLVGASPARKAARHTARRAGAGRATGRAACGQCSTDGTASTWA